MVKNADRFAAGKNPAEAMTSRRQVAAYLIAATVATLTLALRLQLSVDRPFLVLFFIPIIFSAYAGGLGPGLVAVGITAVGAEYYLLPPTHSFLFEKPMDFIQWLLFVIGGVLASGLCEMLHRSRRKADATGVFMR
jgi:K+-sensing histidine kinase KdpD